MESKGYIPKHSFHCGFPKQGKEVEAHHVLVEEVYFDQYIRKTFHPLWGCSIAARHKFHAPLVVLPTFYSIVPLTRNWNKSTNPWNSGPVDADCRRVLVELEEESRRRRF
jgi:hypothetical protein